MSTETSEVFQTVTLQNSSIDVSIAFSLIRHKGRVLRLESVGRGR